MNENKKGRTLKVEDEKAELSGILGNILNFLVLAVLSWVGLNINIMKEDIAEINTITAVESVERKHLAAILERHINNQHAHGGNKR